MKSIPLLLTAVLALAACANDKPETIDQTPPPRSTPTPTQTPLPKDNTLFFLATTNLYVVHTKESDTKLLGDFHSTDVAISPDGQSFAYSTGGDKPTVQVGEVDRRSTIQLEGKDPSWSPDGRYLAAVIPDPNYTICPVESSPAGSDAQPGGCVPGGRVVLYKTDSLGGGKKPKVAIGAGVWDIAGWSGGSIVAYNATEGILASKDPSRSGEPTNVSLFNAGAVSVAHDDLQILAVQGNLLYRGPPEELSPVNVPGRTIETAWSSTGEVKPVPNSEQLVGSAVWSSDGETFAFVTGKRRSLRADLCNVAFTCDMLFESDGAIDLLWLDN
jgi:WD40 repeat protein